MKRNKRELVLPFGMNRCSDRNKTERREWNERGRWWCIHTL